MKNTILLTVFVLTIILLITSGINILSHATIASHRVQVIMLTTIYSSIACILTLGLLKAMNKGESK